MPYPDPGPAPKGGGSRWWKFPVAISYRHAHVANHDAESISQYTVKSDGCLVPVAASYPLKGKAPDAVIVEGPGRFGYVLTRDGSAVLTLHVDPDGKLGSELANVTPWKVRYLDRGFVPHRCSCGCRIGKERRRTVRSAMTRPWRMAQERSAFALFLAPIGAAAPLTDSWTGRKIHLALLNALWKLP